MSNQPYSVEVSDSGNRLSIGFPGQKVPSPTVIADCQSLIDDTIAKHNVEIVSFNVGELDFVPSQMLGFLISLRNRGLEIEFVDPSDFIVESLQVTHLDKYFQIRRSG